MADEKPKPRLKGNVGIRATCLQIPMLQPDGRSLLDAAALTIRRIALYSSHMCASVLVWEMILTVFMRFSTASSKSKILGHDTLLVDDVDTSLLQRLGELDNLGSAQWGWLMWRYPSGVHGSDG
ncbi:hypothetical protein KCU91_g83, partial [Aureobasidium melanogenum]